MTKPEAVTARQVSDESTLQATLAIEVLSGSKVAEAVGALLVGFKEGSLAGLDTETLHRLAGKVSRFIPEQAELLARKKEEFLEKFGIETDGCSLEVNLGKTTPLEFLREAQMLVRELYGKWGINAEALFRWRVNTGFNEALQGDIIVSTPIDSSCPLDVNTCELAVAHAAYFVATGCDLFDGNPVNTDDDDVLKYTDLGLDIAA